MSDEEEIKDEEVAEFDPTKDPARNEFDEDLPDEAPIVDENELVDEDPLRKPVISLEEAEAEESGDADDHDSFDDVDEL